MLASTGCSESGVDPLKMVFISYISFSISTIIWWQAFLSVLAVLCMLLRSAILTPKSTVLKTSTFFSIIFSTILFCVDWISVWVESPRSPKVCYCATWVALKRSVIISSDMTMISYISSEVIREESGSSSSSKSVIFYFTATSVILAFIFLARSDDWSSILSTYSLNYLT